jgi:hypothetical protein
MNTEIEDAVREVLSRQAETVVASDELKRAILDQMAPERAAYLRVQRLRVLSGVAAAVVLAVIAVSVVRGDSHSQRPQPAPPVERHDSQRPQPAPPVPSVEHNAELLDEMPTGAVPHVLIRDEQSTVSSPDGLTFSLGLERSLLGRSGDSVLTYDYSGYSVVSSGGATEELNVPDGGLYAMSPDGRTFYREGTLLDVATKKVTGTMAVPANVGGDYTANWTAAGIVFTTDTDVVLVPMQGAPVPVPALAPPLLAQFAIGSDRVLVTPISGCPFVAELLSSGRLTSVRERCEGDLLSLSRDGSTGLLGERNASPAPPGIGTVTGLLDVDTGAVTRLPWLAGLDEFTSDDSWGDDLFSFTWEDGRAVLLAYYVARDDAESRRGTVRIVRCSLASEMCEVTPGGVHPLLYTATIFSRGIGE